MEKILNVSEVSEVLKVGRQTVLKYIRNGQLKAFKMREWKVAETALTEFIRQKETEKPVKRIRRRTKTK